MLLSVLLLSLNAPAALNAAPSAQAQERGIVVDAKPIELAQMRVRQQIIIRIPRAPRSGRSPMSDVRGSLVKRTFSEKKIGKCLPMDSLRTVQVEGGSYIGLVTRDNRYIRAKLEKRCQARAYYSGFYMEKSNDGNLCVGRDLLHSRTGAKCEIDQIRELVVDQPPE